MKKLIKIVFIMLFVFSFSFSSNVQAALSIPAVETYDLDNSDIGMTNVVLHGEIIKNGGYDITDYGFYYGTSSSGLNNKVSLGAAGDRKFEYVKYISGLNAGEKYYYKAYAVNQLGEGVGSVCSFTTNEPAEPEVDTEDATNIQTTSAILNGTLETNGGYEVTDYGFYYGTDSYNLYNKVSLGYAGSWKGDFSAAVTGLNAGTKYYYRAYAVNQVGEDKGGREYFTTNSNPTPTVTSTPTVTPTPTPKPTVTPTPPATTYAISGKVNYPNGLAMAGAIVKLDNRDGWKTITDVNGYYRISNVGRGDHLFTVEYGDYKQYSNRITVYNADINFDTIWMHGYTVSGYVKYPNSQVPISGAQVVLNGDNNWIAYTDSNGYFSIKDTLPGQRLLTINFKGYISYSNWVTVSKQDLSLGNIWLHCYTVSGYIKDQNNNGVANALVYINDKGKTYTTNSSGYYQFDEVLGGGARHIIYVEKSGYTPYPASISINVDSSNLYDKNIIIRKDDTNLYNLYKDNINKFAATKNISLDGKTYSYVMNTQAITIKSNVYNVNELKFYIGSDNNIVTSKSTIYNLEMARFYYHMQQWNTFSIDSINQRQTDINDIVYMINQKLIIENAVDTALTTYSTISLKALNSEDDILFNQQRDLSKKIRKYLTKRVRDTKVQNMIGYTLKSYRDTFNTEKKQRRFIDAVLSHPNEIEALTNLCMASYYYDQVYNCSKNLNVTSSSQIKNLIKNYDLATEYYEVSIKFAKASDIFKDLNALSFGTWKSELSDKWAEAIISSSITVLDNTKYSWVDKFLKYTVYPLKWYDAIRLQRELYSIYKGYSDIVYGSAANIVSNLSRCQVEMVN